MSDSGTARNFTFQYAKDILINYEVVGVGEQSLLFLPGFGDSLDAWRYLRSLFPGHQYRMFFLDLKGFGNSSKPDSGDYSIDEQARIVSAFIKKNFLTNLTLVGHSYGGAVALFTQMKLPKYIRKLILLDAAAHLQTLPPFLEILRIPVINNLTRLVPASYKARHALGYIFFDQDKITENILERYIHDYSIPGVEQTLMLAAEQIVPKYYESLSEKYHQIAIPTLLIWGDHDRIIPLEIGERLSREIPDSQLKIIEQCGHAPHEEHPVQTYRLMQEFTGGRYGFEMD